jgi:CMP-2-keto-3-deoxyoctulosonic acid synthetase
MKIGAFIPARYAATRFPAKLMQPLGDKSVIRHTYDNTLATGLFDEGICSDRQRYYFE